MEYLITDGAVFVGWGLALVLGYALYLVIRKL